MLGAAARELWPDVRSMEREVRVEFRLWEPTELSHELEHRLLEGYRPVDRARESTRYTAHLRHRIGSRPRTQGLAACGRDGRTGDPGTLGWASTVRLNRP